MSDIFLSYTEHDRDTVRRLAQTLQAVGWTVWWDRRIPAGQTWREVLEREMQSMRCMVVLWSSRSVKSDWVCEEAAEARQLDRLVPVLIERVRPPAGFREVQAADLIDWDGARDFPGLQQLIADIEQMIGKPGTGARETPQPVPPVEDQRSTAPITGRSGYAARDGAKVDRQSVSAMPGRKLLRWGAAASVLLIAGGAYLVTVTHKAAVVSPEPGPQKLESVLPPGKLEEKSQVLPSQPSLKKEAYRVPPIDPELTQAKNKSPESITPRKAEEVLDNAKIKSNPREVERIIEKATATIKPRSSVNPRCAALTERLALGETLSSESQSYFDKECRK